MEILLILLLGGYTYGGWRFWKGFGKTNFNRSLSNRLIFSTFWLPLLIFNKSYRKNYTKALKG